MSRLHYSLSTWHGESGSVFIVIRTTDHSDCMAWEQVESFSTARNGIHAREKALSLIRSLEQGRD